MNNTKYTLGLNVAKADSSASLFRGTEVIAHVEEERFTRKKKALGQFPINAIKYCLSLVPDGLNGIEAINLGFDLDMFTHDVPMYYLAEWEKYKEKPRNALLYEQGRLRDKHPERMKRRIENELREFGIDFEELPPINHYCHHLCHALTAHLSSPYEKSLGLVIDANSEIDCTSIWTCDGTKVEKIYSKGLPHSLGWVYRSFTLMCGFDAYEGEGKLMGLAPYGNPNPELAEKIKKIIIWEEDDDGNFEFSVDATYIYLSERLPDNPGLTKKLVDLFGPPAKRSDNPDQYYKDLAYEIQDRFEQTLLRVARRFLKQTGYRHLTMSGGVALNCKVNGFIWRECQDLLDDIFIFPMSSDDGIGYGANLAYAVEHYSQDKSDYDLENAYLGPEFTDEEIKKAADGFVLRNKFLHERQYSAITRSLELNTSAESVQAQFDTDEGYAELKVKATEVLSKGFTKHDDIIAYTADKLAEGRLVAWFQGKMEAGPRALGSRSILANPTNIENRDRVNAKVKFREIWRPFCPSVLREHDAEYFKFPTQSPFMINTFAVTDKAIEGAPAIVHVDHTARPQFVTKEAYPLFHKLISAFKDRTGVPILLNTSLNIKGEPICCTPFDALNFFFATDIEVLVIGSYSLEKVLD